MLDFMVIEMLDFMVIEGSSLFPNLGDWYIVHETFIEDQIIRYFLHNYYKFSIKWASQGISNKLPQHMFLWRNHHFFIF